MADIALFHPDLGVRRGTLDAADALRAAGHTVTVVDYYGDARTFDTHEAAGAFVADVGFPELMRRALAGCAELPAELVVMGFSNGAGLAEWVATQRPGVLAAVLLSGVLPLAAFGSTGVAAPAWPVGVPVQTHYTRDDPRQLPGAVEAFTAEVRAVGGTVDAHWYDGDGHLFTDVSLPAEYDAAATASLWPQVLAFLDRVGPDGIEVLDDLT